LRRAARDGAYAKQLALVARMAAEKSDPKPKEIDASRRVISVGADCRSHRGKRANIFPELARVDSSSFGLPRADSEGLVALAAGSEASVLDLERLRSRNFERRVARESRVGLQVR
jgi:hypothetical protein